MEEEEEGRSFRDSEEAERQNISSERSERNRTRDEGR